ncbi:multidrug-efflux transporter [Thermoplasma volcanium GSS1]|uniref:Multidrug-efflux transporter n=1 Tax=Thermoplasma volcanium (strain ATCC 51530 / DSM 4299 / JCM 9571 / NBRC 15438 / GSS1) TaxID=273116 RepID=Q979H3_THEVO|nr:MFS transporter [Thermoplasma volcanium]BAB60330.1 multidrug-efflux transporter [Thermoplasma volcanium GSS1]
MVQYKWIALSNTTIGVLMASINATILMISLPAIFRGIDLNPFLPSSFQYLLWILMGYMVVTAVLLVTVGRLSDIFGRVRLFNFGFLIFTVGSILLFLTPGKGTTAATELIFFRMIQAVGGSFLFANSAAIITDAFPAGERGKAMGINQIAGLAGSLIGLIIGGILATINWRYVFLVSVPVGVLGTAWSYLKLKDQSIRRKDEKIDVPGNLTFAGGLTLVLIAITYGLMPYGSSSMGWTNPWVLTAMIIGIGMLVAFPFIELHVDQPMFDMHLFKYRGFTFGNFAGFFQSMGMGGVMFMVIILLQGIWLPLHGYSYTSVPFWAGIYTIPMMAGFVILGPISGALSDKIGARLLTTVGMIIGAVAFILLTLFPYNFSYPPFAATLFLMGAGMGMFGAPNITAVMNSLPAHYRGTGSGMRATLQNTGQTASMGIFFSIVLITLSSYLSSSFNTALASAGASVLIPVFDKIPATSALFSAFLGYNPMGTILSLLPSSFVSLISPSSLSILEGTHWFPLALAPAFMKALHDSFYAGAGILIIAAVLSALRGKRFIYDENINKEAQVQEIGKSITVSSVGPEVKVNAGRDGKK